MGRLGQLTKNLRHSNITCRLKDTTIQPDCQVCNELSLTTRTRLVKLRDVLSAANLACRSCLIICLALDHFDYLEKLVDDEGVYLDDNGCVNISGGHTAVEFYMQPDEDALSSGGSSLFNFKPFSDPTLLSWGAFRLSPPIDRDPLSAVTFAKIRAWLSICEKDHPKCSGMTPLPKRVIDVGEPDARTPCRLYETDKEVANYVALSHCWGPPELIYKSTTNTLEDNKLGLPWRRLSKTFKQAIAMTRLLGVRYLWVDSLCIIQDSTEDWEIEAANMGNIYKNAYITIAATASRSGTGGLFTDRKRDVCDIRLPKSTGPKTAILKVRRQINHHLLLRDDTSDPLSCRAWAYQERILSRRIIHFTSQELIWECRTEQMCECGRLDPSHQFNDRANFESLLSDHRLDSKYSSWEQLVITYSDLELTCETDRLPALSGIASHLFNESDYLAGLRRHHLISDLCWASYGNVNGSVSRQPGAPSWSWASLNASITWGNDKSTLFFSKPLKIIEASCTPEGRNPFGRVSDGYLILKGILLEASLLLSATKSDSSLIKLLTPFDAIETKFESDCTKPEEFSPGTQSVSLLIFYYQTNVIVDTTTTFMLVLRRSSRYEELIYQRIGSAVIKDQPAYFFDSTNPSTIKIV